MSKYPKLPFVKMGALNITLYQKARKMEVIVKKFLLAPDLEEMLRLQKLYHDQFLEKSEVIL